MFTNVSGFSLESGDKSVRVLGGQDTHNRTQNIIENHAFRVGSLMVWQRFHSVISPTCTEEVLYRYWDEVIETIVRLYATVVGPAFVFIDDNERPHRAHIIDEYLESERIDLMD